MIVTGKLHESKGQVKIRTLSVKDAKTLHAGGLLSHGHELRILGSAENAWFRVRVSGRLRTKVRSPEWIELPVKYGMYQSITLGTHDFNSHRVGIVSHG